jgi:hypothetical protein
MNTKSEERRLGKATNAEASSHLVLGLGNVTSHVTQSVGFGVEAAASRIPAECELHLGAVFLEAQMDPALDGILVVDRHGEKILQNQQHRALWKVPPHISEDYTEQLLFFMKQTKNPEEFLKKVSYLYTHPNEVIRDEIELVDGTVLDRYSSPVQNRVGKYYGRAWIFRDITERRRL